MKALEGTSMIAGDLLMGVYIACHRPILGGAVGFFCVRIVPNPIIVDVKAVNSVRISHGYDIELKSITYKYMWYRLKWPILYQFWRYRDTF